MPKLRGHKVRAALSWRAQVTLAQAFSWTTTMFAAVRFTQSAETRSAGKPQVNIRRSASHATEVEEGRASTSLGKGRT
jgi:hypothetical protein